MEEALIDNIQVEPTDDPVVSSTSTFASTNHLQRARFTRAPSTGFARRYEDTSGIRVPEVTSSIDGTSVDVVEARVSISDDVQSDTADNYYYWRVEEPRETAKCVFSSILFVAVIVCILLVAVLKNPGM